MPVSLIFFEERARNHDEPPYLSTHLLAENRKTEKYKITDIHILLHGVKNYVFHRKAKQRQMLNYALYQHQQALYSYITQQTANKQDATHGDESGSDKRETDVYRTKNQL